MKVEVTFAGNSLDTDTYEGEYLSWVFQDGNLSILEGKNSGDTFNMVATYPENRVVRVRVMEAA